MNLVPSKPIVTVVHSLPGRVRMRLSHPLADVQRLVEFVQDHPGMESIEYTARTGSFLVHYDPNWVSAEEITMRTAFCYAMDQGNRPVRLLDSPEHVSLQGSAVVSGVSVLTALAMRWLGTSTSSNKLPQIAGFATALSVLDHGWREWRDQGHIDPEVLTLAYLARALFSGNALTASMVTWVATFGRHLVEMPSTAVLVESVPMQDSTEENPQYELLVQPDRDAPDRLQRGITSFLNNALRYAMTGGGTHGLRSFWEELREISRMHGETLEGYGSQREGIPVRFR